MKDSLKDPMGNPLGNPNNIYPQITRVAIRKLNEIKIYGSDWPTPDGTAIRDYIHVMDLAEGHLNALNYLSEGQRKFISINLGTGKGTSVLELIKIFERVNNVKIPYVFVKRRVIIPRFHRIFLHYAISFFS